MIGGKPSIATNGGGAAALLTETQQLFVEWNAMRLGIPPEESRRRYRTSLQSLHGGHSGPDFGMFADVTHQMFQVFFDDAENEIYGAYSFHEYLHFLAYLSYEEPAWKDNNVVVRTLAERSHVDILDYGCGLAHRSRNLAKALAAQGVGSGLTLVDIPGIRRDFLEWLGERTGLAIECLDATAERPIPPLPACDICIVTEFFEHVHDPIRYFDSIHDALRPGGLLVTNVNDHEAGFMHVSPDLGALRDRIRDLGYEELAPFKIFQKRAVDVPANPANAAGSEVLADGRLGAERERSLQ
jgi:SAM-dependent methyltransferase